MTLHPSPLMCALLAYLLVINVIAFTLYGVDKWKAQHNKWRITERTLLTVAVLGGGFGAGLAMKTFHHKTRKTAFRVVVPLSEFAWLAIAIFLFIYK